MSLSPTPKVHARKGRACQYHVKGYNCEKEPFYEEYEGKPYCVLHYPGRNKVPPFKKALDRKLKVGDYNFRGVWFPDEILFEEYGEKYVFEAETANFSHAIFSRKVSFYNCRFEKGANFFRTAFRSDADFSWTTSGKVKDVLHAVKDVPQARMDFTHASFQGEAKFYSAEFESADFSFATFRDRVSFHSAKPEPHWFINVEARNFDFTNAEWRHCGIKEELASLNSKKVASPFAVLSKAYREIAINYDENHRYEEASKFRYLAMDVKRRERWGGLGLWRLNWWYWLASGYGERVLQAFLCLLLIYITFWAAYTRVGFERWQPIASGANNAPAYYAKVEGQDAPLNLIRSLSYSLEVMTLQRPEPRPATPAAHLMVTLETILGPLQAALLALALRRKFMR